MRTKILVSIILLICMTLSLTSCFIVINHKDGEPEQTDAPIPTDTEEKETRPPAQTFAPQTDALAKGEAKAEELMSSYLGNEYEGKIVITVVGDYFSLLGGESEGTFSRAMGLRNELISQTFHCEIEVQKKDFTAFYEEAVSAKNAGLFYSDLVIMPYSRLGELMPDDLLCNLAQYCDYSAVPSTIDIRNMPQFSGGDRVFAVMGDALLSPSSYLCVYYNKTMASSLGIENLYDAVNNGDWTIGKMKECLSAVSSLGDGYYCIGSELEDEQLFSSVFNAAGMRFMNTGLGVVPSLAGYNERTDTLVEELRALADGGSLYCRDANVDKKALFEEGKMLFYIGNVADSETLNNNFGMLPMPKLDKEQARYYTPITDDAPVMCVLSTASDPKKSIDVINGYNDASAMLFDGYVRDFLDLYARDGESAVMLKNIVSRKTFDFVNTVRNEYSNVRYATTHALYSAVTSKKSIKTVYNQHRYYANYDMQREFQIK